MLCLFDTGTIDLKENVLTWNIQNFFSLPLTVGSEIRTPEFQYGEFRYTLALWPRGLKGAEREWFGVCLYSRGVSKQHGFIRFSIMTGGRVLKSCKIMCSDFGNYQNDRFMEWSDFCVLKGKIAPNGCLTVVCSLFCEKAICLENYELEDSIAMTDGIECLPSQSWFRSGEYSFLNSSCMIPSPSFNSSSRKSETSVAPNGISRASPSGISNSTFSASSDAFDLPSHANSALADSDSPESCSTVAAAAFERNSNGRHGHKRTATASGLSISSSHDDEMTNADGESDRLSKPGPRAESQSATECPQTRSTSNHATAGKNNIVSKENMPPCRHVSANSTSQQPRKSAIKGSHEISPSDSVGNFETTATAWNEYPASSIRTRETNTSGFGTSETHRMSNTHEAPASAIANEEGKTPAHVLYSSVGNADPPHFGKTFTAEIYHHKGPLNKNRSEPRPLTENSPLSSLGNDRLLKLRANVTSPSASNAIPSAKRRTARMEEAEDPVMPFQFENSATGVPAASDAASNNQESYISAAEKGPATSAGTISSDFVEYVSSELLKLRAKYTSPSASNAIPSAKRRTARIEEAEDPVMPFQFENSATGVPTASDAASNNQESYISAAEQGPATSAGTNSSDFVENDSSETLSHYSFPEATHAAGGTSTHCEETPLAPSNLNGAIQTASGTDHVSGSDDAANGRETQAEFRRHLQSMENLSEALRRFYLQREGCDLTIKINDHEFPVHRSFLKSRSPVFDDLLSENEGRTLEIPPGSCDPATFHDFLLFVYDGKVGNVTESNVCGMYRAAQYFRFPELSAQCVEFMMNSLSVHLVCDVLSAATQHNETELLERATVYFEQNVREIMETDEWKQLWSRGQN